MSVCVRVCACVFVCACVRGCVSVFLSLSLSLFVCVTLCMCLCSAATQLVNLRFFSSRDNRLKQMPVFSFHFLFSTVHYQSLLF